MIQNLGICQFRNEAPDLETLLIQKRVFGWGWSEVGVPSNPLRPKMPNRSPPEVTISVLWLRIEMFQQHWMLDADSKNLPVWEYPFHVVLSFVSQSLVDQFDLGLYDAQPGTLWFACWFCDVFLSFFWPLCLCAVATKSDLIANHSKFGCPIV